MKVLFVFLIIFESFVVWNNADDNELYWSKTRLLSWPDFRGKAPDSTDLSAAVSVRMKFNYEANKKTISIQLYCFMDKKESWYKDTSNYALSHEQRHFDIGELVVRMMRKHIDSISKARRKLDIDLIKKIFDSYANRLFEMQDLYDEETNHSRNFGEQIKWDSLVYNGLEKLDKFEDANKKIFAKRVKD